MENEEVTASETLQDVDVADTVVETATPVGDMWQQRAQYLETQINSVDERVNQEKDKALRAMAELENFKRRKVQEVDQFKRFAKEQTVLDLLPVLDSFDRACEHANSEQSEEDQNGFLLIQKQFHQVLEKWGVSPVPALGQPFDPHRHQAVMEEEQSDTVAGTVIREMQKGYTLNEKVIRPSMVVVSK